MINENQKAKLEMKFRRTKGLCARLREMPIGSEANIRSAEYAIAVVRSTVYKLKREGLLYDVTVSGLINECKVTRLR